MVNERYLEDLKNKKTKALSNCDALEYFTACNELGQYPELLQLYDAGEQIYRANKREQSKLEKIADLKGFKIKIKQMKGLNPNDLNAYIPEKRKYIHEVLKYSVLKRKKTHKNEQRPREPVNMASNYKVALVFQKNYQTLLNKIDNLVKELGI